MSFGDTPVSALGIYFAYMPAYLLYPSPWGGLACDPAVVGCITHEKPDEFAARAILSGYARLHARRHESPS